MFMSLKILSPLDKMSSYQFYRYCLGFFGYSYSDCNFKCLPMSVNSKF